VDPVCSRVCSACSRPVECACRCIELSHWTTDCGFNRIPLDAGRSDSPSLKLSMKRTQFLSSGTVVPPDVTTTMGVGVVPL
jgi:hypothetical protein